MDEPVVRFFYREYGPGPRRLPRVRQTPPASGVKAYLAEFLESSSIHGLAHLADKRKHASEYLLWVVVLAAAVVGTTYMGLNAWRRYQHFPTVVSIEKDYKNWNTTFAAVVLCPEAKLDEEKLREIAKRYDAREDEFVEFFAALSHASYSEFAGIPDYGEVAADDYLEILIEARFNLTFKPSNTKNVLQEPLPMVTETGICYAVNSEIGVYFSPENFRRRLAVRRGNSELVTGNPLDGEVFGQMMDISSGYNVTLGGPFDVPDVSSRRIAMANASQYLVLDITALSIVSSDPVRNLSPQQRKCRFFDESHIGISDVYSYNLCRMQCRADLSHELCGCVPHFYRPHGRRAICNATGLRCIGRHGRYLSDLRENDLKVDCGCLPLCNDVHYSIELEHHIPWPKHNHLKYSMERFPRTRLRREVIFGFSDFLVSIGGTAGLLLGCSVLSFVEIVYFATLRLFFFLLPLLHRHHHHHRTSPSSSK